jgi:hypothetical protein
MNFQKMASSSQGPHQVHFLRQGFPAAGTWLVFFIAVLSSGMQKAINIVQVRVETEPKDGEVC